MEKQRKPNATRKPPVPSDSHAEIEDWAAFQMAPQTRCRIHAPTLVERVPASERYADRRGPRALAYAAVEI
jgi:hypothetical protein